MKYKVALAVGLVSLLFGSDVRGDLVLLADFETGSTYPGEWRYPTTGADTNALYTYIKDGAAGGSVYEGTRAVSIENTGAAYARWFLRDAGLPQVSSGLEYTFSVMLKTENMDNSRVYIQILWLNGSKANLSGTSQESISISTDQDWSLLSVSGVAPDGAVYMRPQMIFRPIDMGSPAGDGAKATFDNATITVIPEPLSLGMIGIGYPVLIGLRRFVIRGV